MTSRRGFLLGFATLLAAPAIVRAESLMQIAVLRESVAPKVFSPDHEGFLWEGRTKRGTWTQLNGVFNFKYANPAGPVYEMSGKNHSFERMMQVLPIMGATFFEGFGARI